uniref:Shugoshin C-terminal domain-containing protein n=1 Tax=Acrobeloides nanus TaxID=290746 RepID=A0A914DLJ1_9BILA
MPKLKDLKSSEEFLERIRILELHLQLERRKTQKLSEENQQLITRINNLLSNDDHRRLKLLVSDGVRKQLAQLKALSSRGIDSLQYIIKQFDEFQKDIESEVEKAVDDGALNPLPPIDAVNPALMLPKFEPELSKKSPAIANDTLTPEDSSTAENKQQSRSDLTDLQEETTFVMQTPAARSQNLRRRRALTMDEIENIPPKPAGSEDDVDIVEDSMLTEDTKEVPAEPPTVLSEQNDESILTHQESLFEDSESTLKAERSNASKDQLNKNETSLPMEQVLSPRIEVTTLPLETTAIIEKENEAKLSSDSTITPTTSSVTLMDAPEMLDDRSPSFFPFEFDIESTSSFSKNRPSIQKEPSLIETRKSQMEVVEKSEEIAVAKPSSTPINDNDDSRTGRNSFATFIPFQNQPPTKSMRYSVPVQSLSKSRTRSNKRSKVSNVDLKQSENPTPSLDSASAQTSSNISERKRKLPNTTEKDVQAGPSTEVNEMITPLVSDNPKRIGIRQKLLKSTESNQTNDDVATTSRPRRATRTLHENLNISTDSESTSRPRRKATTKITSLKEPSLGKKMRRE